MDQYKTYLATEVINEQKIVNYRQLSRALQVHVDTAKQMLYAFHKDRNGKRPGSVHATYQIIGRRPPLRYAAANGAGSQDDEDVEMEGNPFQSSAPETQEIDEDVIAVTAVVLAQEEDLEEAKETFDIIDTIYVYSVEPSRLQDIQVLSTCNAEVLKKSVTEDPLETWKVYGGIRDPNCKRRTARKPAIAAAPAAAQTTTAKPAKASEPSKEPTESSKPNTSKAPTGKKAPAAAATKPRSNPFANFKKTTGKPAEAAPAAPAEDTTMADAPSALEFDDDGEEDDDDFPVVSSKSNVAQTRQAREEREARLRAMMEEEDEEEEEKEEAKELKKQEDDDDEQMADAEPVVEAAPAEPVGAEQNVKVQNGRRRGRRKVVKKKTVKDEEGYLVTKEETVWESFSEDEPEQKKAKAAPAPVKKKAAAGKPGQGNIMSFFSKK